MDKIKEEIARKRLQTKGLTLDQNKQKQMEEKQRLFYEAEQREKEKVKIFKNIIRMRRY